MPIRRVDQYIEAIRAGMAEASPARIRPKSKARLKLEKHRQKMVDALSKLKG